jgi:hypothetical protein
MWLKVVLLALILILACMGLALAYGEARWKTGTKELRARLESGQMPIGSPVYRASEVIDLPPPVKRYFQTVLKDGQPMISGVKLAHKGQFNMGETEEKWSPFTATQRVITQRPGFDWDGRIQMIPGLSVRVHDAYVLGEGILQAKLSGLATLADVRGTPEVAEGELMRFLAEAAWYPTALLPSQGVRWEAIDDTSAKATLTDGATTVSLAFYFDADDLITMIRAEQRYRTENRTLAARPWQVKVWAYEVRDGLRIPLEGEVAWELPNGLFPHWRGRLSAISVE